MNRNLGFRSGTQTALLAVALVVALGTSAQTPEAPRLPSGSWGTVHPELLNKAELEVFFDEKGGSNVAGHHIFTRPVFLPQWEAFAAKVESDCQGVDDSTRRQIPLHTEFVTPLLKEQVLAEVNSADDTDYKPQQLMIYPYYAIVVTTHPFGQGTWSTSTIQWSFPSGTSSLDSALEAGLKRTLDVGVGNGPGESLVTISESCGELRRIARDRTVKAWILTQRVEGTATTYSASVDFATIVSGLLDLNRKEDQSGQVRVVSTSSGRSRGLSIGPIARAGSTGNSITTSESSVKRFVSMNLIQDAVRRYASRASIRFISETGAGTASREPLDQLMKYVENQLTLNAQEASFERVGANQYKVRIGQLDRTLSEADTTELLQSAPDTKFHADKDVQVKIAAVEVKGKGTVENQTKDNIVWKREGDGWVPLSTTVYAVDGDDFQSSASFAMQELTLSVAQAPMPVELGTVVDAHPTTHTYDVIAQKVGAVRQEARDFSIAPAKQVIPTPQGMVKLRAVRISTGEAIKHLGCQDVPDVPAQGFERVGGAETSDAFAGRSGRLVNVKVGTASYQEAQRCIKAKKSNFMPYCTTDDRRCETVYWASGCHVNSEWLTWYRDRQRNAGLPPSIAEMCYVEPQAPSDGALPAAAGSPPKS